MTVKTGSAWAGTFVTLDATGALATPSTGPAGTLYVDGVANGATVTITGSNPYKFAVTLPSLTAGQRVDMYITATISSIATAGVVASAQADTVLVSDVKTETAAILEDTGNTLDGLIKDVPTVAEFEARTKPAADYALEATLTAIKGAGWTNETLAAIDTLIDAIKAKSDLIPAQPAAVGSAMTLTSAYDAAKSAASQSSVNAIPTAPLLAANYTAPDNAGITAIKAKTDNLPASPAAVGSLMGLADGAITDAKIATDALSAAKIKADAVTKIQNGLALEATLTAIKGAGWTNETLAKIVVDISNISAGSGATAQEVWEYATRVLTAGTNIDLSSLATTTHLQEVEDKVDGIKVKTDNLPADPADDSDIDAQLAAVKTVVDAIKTETDGHPTAAEVWSYGTRTLTNSTTGAVTPAEGDTLEVTKDATIIINFTGLGDISAYDDDTTDEEDKVWFTAKANLDDPDSSAVIQIHTLYPAGTTPPDTLDYINGAAATATEGTFQFTDLVAGDATLTLAAAAAVDLPVYAVSPLYWDIKILDYSAGTVSVLASGEMYIYGTPTKSIA